MKVYNIFCKGMYRSEFSISEVLHRLFGNSKDEIGRSFHNVKYNGDQFNFIFDGFLLHDFKEEMFSYVSGMINIMPKTLYEDEKYIDYIGPDLNCKQIVLCNSSEQLADIETHNLDSIRPFHLELDQIEIAEFFECLITFLEPIHIESRANDALVIKMQCSVEGFSLDCICTRDYSGELKSFTDHLGKTESISKVQKFTLPNIENLTDLKYGEVFSILLKDEPENFLSRTPIDFGRKNSSL